MVHGSGEDPILLLTVTPATPRSSVSTRPTTTTTRRTTSPPTSVSTSSTSGGVSGSCIHIVLLVLYSVSRGRLFNFRLPVLPTTPTAHIWNHARKLNAAGTCLEMILCPKGARSQFERGRPAGEHGR